jgi:hypothetical protein
MTDRIDQFLSLDIRKIYKTIDNDAYAIDSTATKTYGPTEAALELGSGGPRR